MALMQFCWTDHPRIKRQIKVRQHAFTKGNKERYEYLNKKVSNFIVKVKERYYQYEDEGLCKCNSVKWFVAIYYDLAGANASQGQISSSEATAFASP